MTVQAVAKNIGMWLVERLVPWAKNPHTHSDAQVAQIAASIAELGFNNPMPVGHRWTRARPLAARKLGL